MSPVHASFAGILATAYRLATQMCTSSMALRAKDDQDQEL